MSDPKKVIAQNAGFVSSALDRADAKEKRSKELAAEGRNQGSKAAATEAKNLRERAKKANETIGRRVKEL